MFLVGFQWFIPLRKCAGYYWTDLWRASGKECTWAHWVFRILRPRNGITCLVSRASELAKVLVSVVNEQVSTKETSLGIQQSLTIHWIFHVGLVQLYVPCVNAILRDEPLALLIGMIIGALLDEGVARTWENITASQVVHEGGLLDQGAELLGDAVAEDVALDVVQAEHLAGLDAHVHVAQAFTRHWHLGIRSTV